MQVREWLDAGLIKILTFTLNDICFGIPIKDVEYVQPLKNGINLNGIPDTRNHIKGIAMLHGKSVPVYNLASMFGFSERKFNNLVVVNVNGMKLAFEVEGDCGIVDLGEKEVFPLPTGSGMSKRYFKNIVALPSATVDFTDRCK